LPFSRQPAYAGIFSRLPVPGGFTSIKRDFSAESRHPRSPFFPCLAPPPPFLTPPRPVAPRRNSPQPVGTSVVLWHVFASFLNRLRPRAEPAFRSLSSLTIVSLPFSPRLFQSPFGSDVTDLEISLFGCVSHLFCFSALRSIVYPLQLFPLWIFQGRFSVQRILLVEIDQSCWSVASFFHP